MTIINNLKKPYILLTLILIVLTIIWYVVRVIGTARLEVYVEPNDAEISLDNIKVGEGSFSSQLAKGYYQIRVERINYITQLLDVNLNGNETLTINLVRVAKENEPVSGVYENIDDFQFNAGVVDTQQNLIGTNDLKQITQLVGDKLEVIYPNPIYQFSFTDPLISILNHDDFENIYIYNIQDRTVRRIQLSNFSQIIATAISKDLQTLYFVGSYDTINRTASIYSTPLDSINPIVISNNVALSLEPVNSSLIAAYLPSEEQDLGRLKVLDINTGDSVYSLPSNSFGVSPSGEYVYSQTSKEINLIDINNSIIKNIRGVPLSAKLLWKNENTIVAIHENLRVKNSISINYIDPESGTVVQNALVELPKDTGVRFVWGIANNKLYATDSAGELIQVAVP